MTLVSSPGWVWPEPYTYGNMLIGTVSFTNTLMDAATEKAAGVFVAPKDGQIARLHFRTATVTTGDTLKLSWQDVDPATGNPDGVADQFRTQVINAADDNVWFRSSLITSDGTDTGSLRTVTMGVQYAYVIEFNSFVAGSLNIAGMGLSAARLPFVMRNYPLLDASAGYAKQDQRANVAAIEYSDGSFAYMPNFLPASTQAATAVNTGTNPSEVALKFSLTHPARVSGWWAAANFAGDCDVILYDSDGTTPLKTDTVDKDNKAVANVGVAMGNFTSSVSLLKNTFYYLSFKPSTATSVTLTNFTVHSTPGAAILDTMSGGQNVHWADRAGGAWSPNTLRRLCAGLIFDGFDDGAGGMSRSRIVNAGGV